MSATAHVTQLYDRSVVSQDLAKLFLCLQTVQATFQVPNFHRE